MSEDRSQPCHLYEADKVRIANEAKVRTAMEDPDFAEREYRKWRASRERWRDSETHTSYWAKLAWLAEGRTLAMGRSLDKVSRRLGKQRQINKAQRKRIKELELEVDKVHREWLEQRTTIGDLQEQINELKIERNLLKTEVKLLREES